jgi:hypothetical protein
MKQHIDGWPELTYRYIEHYAWEPQQLLLTSHGTAGLRGQERIQKVYEKLRRQEVPLNYLLNLLLRLVPSTIRRECLEPFGIDLSDPGLSTLFLRTPWDYDHIQPDVHMESETTRVFIEVKLNAPLTLEQIKKYVKLAKPDSSDNNTKRPYVLFLVKSATLTIGDIKQSFAHDSSGWAVAAQLDAKANGITFGSTSWTTFGQALQ